jgi:hypothetical protein
MEAITTMDALAGSGTLEVGKDNPLAAAKASKAATSPGSAYTCRSLSH